MLEKGQEKYLGRGKFFERDQVGYERGKIFRSEGKKGGEQK